MNGRHDRLPSVCAGCGGRGMSCKKRGWTIPKDQKVFRDGSIHGDENGDEIWKGRVDRWLERR